MNMIISFIVPMYNAEKYISHCLDSLLNQNIAHSQYEIIVINDGSSDQSKQIVEKYQEIYQNISLFNKENNGASTARNLGISSAKGKYIWMVDADDTIKANCLKDLLEFAETKELDFISFPINDIFLNYNKSTLSNFMHKPKNIIVSNIEYLDKYKLEYSPCCFIIKRICLQSPMKVRFIEGITQEDFDFVIRAVNNCQRISSFQNNGALYNYFVGREGSVTSNIKNTTKYIKTLESFYISISYLLETFTLYQNRSSYDMYANYYINNIKCYALSYLLYFPLSYKYKFLYYKKYYNINIHNISETRFLSKRINFMLFFYKRAFLYKTILFLTSFINLPVIYSYLYKAKKNGKKL